jgi:5-carboxymethyl-2-hydroxymuconate isomerase
MKPSDFHWAECTIERVLTEERNVIVFASGVFRLGAVGPRRVRVEFRSSATARQEITEYIGDPRRPEGFRQPLSIELLPPIESSGAEAFGIEGIRLEPKAAWIDIEVHAAEAEVYEL